MRSNLRIQGAFLISGAIMTDIIPVGITNVSYINSGVMVTPTGNVSYTWQVAEIPPGAGGIITITGIVEATLSNEVLITNTAVFTANYPTLFPTNATAVLEINIPPELDIVRFYDILLSTTVAAPNLTLLILF